MRGVLGDAEARGSTPRGLGLGCTEYKVDAGVRVGGAEAQRHTWAGFPQSRDGGLGQQQWWLQSTAWPPLAWLSNMTRVVSIAGRERPPPQWGSSAAAGRAQIFQQLLEIYWRL